MTSSFRQHGLISKPEAASHFIDSSDLPGLRLHLRERRPPENVTSRTTPLLLVHGATVASALWDTPLPGWSWMDRLALDGFRNFAVDLRGYGGSGRPESFNYPPEEHSAFARAKDVLADVSDTIDFVLNATGADQVDLLGGSWGSLICGLYAARHARNRIRRLVLYAPLFSETEYWPDWLPKVDSNFDDASVADRVGAYRWVSVDQLRSRWDSEIPIEDKSLWRPKGMLEAMTRDYLEFRPGEEGQAIRVPNGTLVDLCHVFSGRGLYDPAELAIPVLLIRGSADPISTAKNALQLLDALGSRDKHLLTIEHGSHFMVAERALPEVHAGITRFLSQTEK